MTMFTGKELGLEITPDEGRKKAKKFKANRKKGQIKAHYFSRAVLEKLLENPENVGIRVYTGNDDKDELDNFIVAVNAAGDNVFKGEFTIEGDKDMPAGSSGIYASAWPCPSKCPTSNTDFA
jgi:formylmethanofuran dehydrogenase subunit C